MPTVAIFAAGGIAIDVDPFVRLGVEQFVGAATLSIVPGSDRCQQSR